MKRIIYILVILLLSFFWLIAVSEWQTAISKEYIFTEISEIPNTKVGLVLGTSKYIADGRRNLFYLYRLDAAKALYDAERIEYILVSGDNGSVDYNETDTMKTDLVVMWIPEERIYGDYAGFRTLDSVVRAREIFGQEKYIIITQKFHLKRALYLARHEWIDAFGYPARDVPVSLAPRVWIGERLARVKMMYDIIVWVEPKFGGEKVKIE